MMTCEFCKKQVRTYGIKKKKFCSKSCSNKSRIGMNYGSGRKSDSKRRIALLQKTFGIKTCMVQGCEYSRTFDIHRMVAGKDDGKYIIGNMFAICPNHHAEITRNVTVATKINDYNLKLNYDQLPHLPLIP